MGDVIEINRHLRMRQAPDPDCEAERELLIAMCLFPAVARAFAALMPSEWMTYEPHRQIFEAMCAVVRRGERVTLISLSIEIASRGQYEEVLGDYLISLMMEKKHGGAI